MKRLIPFAATLSLSLSLPTQATEAYCNTDKPHAIDSAMAKRLDTATTTVDMRNAQGEAYTAWDKELNRVYGALMRSLANDQESAAKLKKAQKAWLAYRDGEIEWLWSNAMYADAGTSGPLNVSGAGIEMVRQRTCELERSLQVRGLAED